MAGKTNVKPIHKSNFDIFRPLPFHGLLCGQVQITLEIRRPRSDAHDPNHHQNPTSPRKYNVVCGPSAAPQTVLQHMSRRSRLLTPRTLRSLSHRHAYRVLPPAGFFPPIRLPNGFSCCPVRQRKKGFLQMISVAIIKSVSRGD